jgi:hypothetical protein
MSVKDSEIVDQFKWEDVLNGLCYINNECVILNYLYFKNLALNETYNIIINYITFNIDKVLATNNKFTIYINNMKHFSLKDIEKHKTFVQTISVYFKNKYPTKLEKCVVYNAPFIFTQFINIVSMFIDKETQKKIELVKTY